MIQRFIPSAITMKQPIAISFVGLMSMQKGETNVERKGMDAWVGGDFKA